MSELESLQRRWIEVLNENLQIRQEQFDQAMTMLKAERAAHAAEVARLRSELSAAHESFEEIHCGNAQCESKYGGCDQACKGEAYRASQRIEAALATPPAAAVEAVEGLVRALEAVPHELYCESMKRANVPEEMCTCLPMSSRKMARAALAAWKEAIHGKG